MQADIIMLTEISLKAQSYMLSTPVAMVEKTFSFVITTAVYIATLMLPIQRNLTLGMVNSYWHVVYCMGHTTIQVLQVLVCLL